MDGASPRKLLGIAAAFVALVLTAPYAGAQTVVVSGRVLSTGQQPLAGASVSIPELGVGSIAGEDGRYNFTVDASRARGRQVNLVARYIGYKPRRLPITITGERVEHNFALERDVLQLEQRLHGRIVAPAPAGSEATLSPGPRGWRRPTRPRPPRARRTPGARRSSPSR